MLVHRTHPWRWVALLIASCTDTVPEEGSHSQRDGSPALEDAGYDATSEPPANDAEAPKDAGPDASRAEVDAGPASLVVRVAGGLLQGSAGGTLKGHSFDARRFLGIPYGAAPIGELRFAPPQPAAPWSDIRSATTFGPRCVGIAGAQAPEGMSEDCLTLNVFTPPVVPTEGLPVMVFLYGGGFQTGSAAVEAQWLTPRDVVVVTLNYRVGALGFMAHPSIDEALSVPSGNLGLRDQQLALRWVHDNVAAFGGDPRRITLFGESAGALSSCIHMLARGSEGLAHAFVMESGACLAGSGRVRSRAQVEQASRQLVDALCPFAADDDVIDCLRSASAQDFASPLAPGVLSAGYWPYVDGQLIPDTPRAMIERGELSDAPFIVGSNLNERRFFDDIEGTPVVDRLTFALAIRAKYPDAAEAILEHYALSSDAEAYATWVRVWTDEYFRCPARLLARLGADAGRTAYLYSFDVAPAVHSQELDYVFAWPCCGVSAKYEGIAPYPLLSNVVATMQGYWTNLARTGDPNDASLPRWTPYTRAADPHLVFDTKIAPGSALSRDDCDFWDAIYAKQP